jgi:dTDP-4-amino-4,6-dideoxygalactose transaminase
MNIPFVDLKAQYKSIKEEIDKVIFELIERTAFVGGPYVDSFEAAFANFCRVKHCIGVGNGTDALFIALRALGIGPGDEVITAANSFIATSEAITMAGAKVAFVDIDPKTYNMDPNKLEDYLRKRNQESGVGSQESGAWNLKPCSSRPRAVIPVHLYGQPADMDPIMEIATKYKLKVVEDAAQAHGAQYKGRPVGSFGDAACFSFYPGKNLGAYGDGGAIVTNDDDIAVKARMFANHGSLEKYKHEMEGVNSRLDGIQAAVLEVKLRHLREWTERRRNHAYLYSKYLKDSGVVTPFEPEDVKSVYHLYVVRVKVGHRENFQNYLKTKGISTGLHYPIALPNLGAYAYLNCRNGDFPEATKASQEIVSLPMFAELEESQIRYVTDHIKEFFKVSKSSSIGRQEGERQVSIR